MEQPQTLAAEPNGNVERATGDQTAKRAALMGGIEAWIALAIVVVDQVSKAYIRTAVPVYEDMVVIPGFLHFAHVRNSGAAFGLLNGIDFPFKAAIIATVAAAALVAIAVYAARIAPGQRLARLGLALILGGAVGNLIDRVTLGYVVDFVDVFWGSYHFWAFNVADAAITMGVTAMVLDMLGLGSHASKTV